MEIGVVAGGSKHYNRRMARTILIRIEPAVHASVVDAAHAARTSLQEFCLEAILDAATRWSPTPPPAAHAACDESLTEPAWP